MNPLFPVLESDDVLAISRMKVDQSAEDDNGRTPLHRAVAAGATDCALWLLDQSTEAMDRKDRQGETPLMRAAWLGNQVLVEALLERGANVGLASLTGGTALHHAYGGGKASASLRESLVKSGADPTATDASGKTPEQWTAYADVLRVGETFGRASRSGVLSLKRR